MFIVVDMSAGFYRDGLSQKTISRYCPFKHQNKMASKNCWPLPIFSFYDLCSPKDVLRKTCLILLSVCSLKIVHIAEHSPYGET
jgi:hypothetical protein